MNQTYTLSDNVTNNLQNPTQSTDNTGIAIAKDMFRTRSHTATPSNSDSFFEISNEWQVENRANGIDGVRDPLAILSGHFKVVVREALSTGIILDMNSEEKRVFGDYVKWVDMDCSPSGEEEVAYECMNDIFMLTTPENILISLDKWLVAEVECLPQRGEMNPDMHSWTVCTAPCIITEKIASNDVDN